MRPLLTKNIGRFVVVLLGITAAMTAGGLVEAASAYDTIYYCGNGETYVVPSSGCFGRTVDPGVSWYTPGWANRNFNTVQWERPPQMRLRYQMTDLTYVTPAIIGGTSPLQDLRTGYYKAYTSNQGGSYADYVLAKTTRPS
jgi:hypothetical protein